ncbi:MAG: metabolite traffic protein EboE [Pirellulales bacterium]|jgi:hypothetical protein
MSVPQWIGYCTNVHAGATLEQTRANLQEHAVRVRQLVSADQPIGVGLWLSAEAARSLRSTENGVAQFRSWLSENQLMPYTLNGFPYGDFHQKVVKLEVYKPTWMDRQRLDYTLDLVAILDGLLPPGDEGSISTVPITWGQPEVESEKLEAAAAHLRELANHLETLDKESGRLIYLCIEPEPGCVIDTTDDMIEFFHKYLLNQDDAEMMARYIRVCHDVCHAAVMFEDQTTVLEKYAAAGIAVGKVQVSSAIEVDFGSMDSEQKSAAIQRLSQFAEDKYMHQTSTRNPAGETVLHYDLPDLLKLAEAGEYLDCMWRIHFHMPIYLQEFGELKTTQSHIIDLLNAGELIQSIRHWEVETYAWGVLPAELQHEHLSDGIAKEICWLKDQLK